MAKATIKKIQPQIQSTKKSPWTNLVDFLRRVNAARRSEILAYNKRLSLLSRIAKTINSEIEINKILRLILKGAVNLTNSNAGVIFFKKRGKLEAIESYGIKVIAEDLIIRPWRGIVGHVLSSKRSYLCNNTDKDKYFVAWGSGKRAHSELAVPIVIEGEVFGVLIASSRDYDKYSRVDERLLKDLSENASIAIKNAKTNQYLEERIRQVLASRMQFLADVSHELRTPLTIIQGNLELIRRGQSRLNGEDKEAIDDVVVEAKNISKKLEGLISMIHDEAQAPKMKMSKFYLDDLIRQVSNQAKKIGRRKKIEVITGTLPKIEFRGDQDKIREMLLNIASNAIKYNRLRGKVWIEAELKNNQTEIKISDTGIGIAGEDLPFIFDRFYRARQIERIKRQAGSGIGLAVSRYIARAHGGDIKVESKIGIGTKFRVILPFLINS